MSGTIDSVSYSNISQAKKQEERKLLDKDVQVRKKEDAKYKKRTACLLLCLSYR